MRQGYIARSTAQKVPTPHSERNAAGRPIMGRTFLWRPALLAFCLIFWRAHSQTPIKILLIDGYSNHDWKHTSSLIRGILLPTKLFDVTTSTAPASASDPAYATWCPPFSQYQVVIQNCNDIGGAGPVWPEKARIAFENFVRNGGGVFAFHSANNAFSSWPAYDTMLGLAWRDKSYGYALQIGPNDSIIKIPPGAGESTGHQTRQDRVVNRIGDHPIHTGLPRTWKTPLIEVYAYARGPAVNVTPLSWAADPVTDVHWPIEWTSRYGSGLVYTSTFGHVWAGETTPVDMQCAGFQTVFMRALQWLAKQPITVPVPTDFPTAQATSLRPLQEVPVKRFPPAASLTLASARVIRESFTISGRKISCTGDVSKNRLLKGIYLQRITAVLPDGRKVIVNTTLEK